MSNYLVTGFRGYIGSVLCKMLKEHGHTVYGYDPRNQFQERSKYIDGEFSLFDAIPFGVELDGTFYIGAHSLLNESLSNPLKFFDNNVGGLIRDLGRLINMGYDKGFVFASSAAVYGNPPKREPIREYGVELNPRNPYGLSKKMGEEIIANAARVGKFKFFNMRFFNVAGAYGDVGQARDQPHLLTALCKYADWNDIAPPFVHYGDNIRDFVHVKDVCFALIGAMNELNKSPYEEGHDPDSKMISYHVEPDEFIGNSIQSTDRGLWFGDGLIHPYSNESLNISTGVGTSTKDFIEAFAKITGNKIEVSQQKRRRGDPQYLVGDSSRAQEILNWKPYHSGIAEIIESALEYYNRKE